MPAPDRPSRPLRPRSPAAVVEAILTRIAPAVVFLAFGVGKFTNHASEASSFRAYGLPHPDAFAYAIGVVEIVGGLLLLSRASAPLAALVLAGDMVGAIVVSGIGRGEMVSLTLAPALLVAMVVVLVRLGPAFWRERARRGAP